MLNTQLQGFGSIQNHNNTLGSLNFFQRTKALLLPTKKNMTEIENVAKLSDPVDEATAGLAHTLPQAGQVIAAMPVLLALIPIFYLGIKGMAIEANDATNSYDKLKTKVTEIQNKLADFLEISVEDIKKLSSETFKEKFQEKLLNLSNDNPQFEELLQTIVSYKSNVKKKKSAQLAKEATPYGLLSLMGTFGGMFPTLAGDATEIVKEIKEQALEALEKVAEATEAGHQSAETIDNVHTAVENTDAVQKGIETLSHAVEKLEPVIHGLEIAGASLFLPAQAFMFIYASKKAHEGWVKHNKLQADKKAIQDCTGSEISEDLRKDVLENLDRRIKYNKVGKIAAGHLTQVGQAGMMVGGILSLAKGAGLPILIPFAGVSLVGAGLRMYAEDKKDKFTGHETHSQNNSIRDAVKNIFSKKRSDDVFVDVAAYTPDNRYEGAISNISDSEFEDNISQIAHVGSQDSVSLISHNENRSINGLETKLQEKTDLLAKQKIYSLLLKAICEFSHSDKREIHFKEMLKTGKKSIFQGTTLQKNVIKKMNALYPQPQDAPKTDFQKQCDNIMLLRTQDAICKLTRAILRDKFSFNDIEYNKLIIDGIPELILKEENLDLRNKFKKAIKKCKLNLKDNLNLANINILLTKNKKFSATFCKMLIQDTKQSIKRDFHDVIGDVVLLAHKEQFKKEVNKTIIDAIPEVQLIPSLLKNKITR